MNTASYLEKILKQFYAKVSAKHPHVEQKIIGLQLAFNKNEKNTEYNQQQKAKEQKQSHVDTEASEQEELNPSLSLSRALSTPSLSWNMNFTFMPSNEQRQMIISQVHCEEIRKDQTHFYSKSIFKIVFYSIFVQYFRIEDNYLSEKSQNNKQLLYEWIQKIGKIRKSMIRAAYKLKKTLNCKEYAKIRYLDQHFMKIIEKKQKNQDKYLKVIIQEYENNYIEQIFKELHAKINQKVNKLKPYSSLLGLCDILSSMEIKLTIVSNQQIQQIGSSNDKNDILVKKQSDGFFKFNEIMSCFNQLLERRRNQKQCILTQY